MNSTTLSILLFSTICLINAQIPGLDLLKSLRAADNAKDAQTDARLEELSKQEIAKQKAAKGIKPSQEAQNSGSKNTTNIKKRKSESSSKEATGKYRPKSEGAPENESENSSSMKTGFSVGILGVAVYGSGLYF